MKSWQIIGAVIAMGTAAAANAAFTEPDPTFGTEGHVSLIDPSTTGFAAVSDGAQGADGLLYVLVQAHNAVEVARLTSAGVVDTTFGSGGFITLSGLTFASQLGVNTASKTLYVANRANIYAYSFTGAGVSTYGVGGTVALTSNPLDADANIYGIVVLSNGNILVAGVDDKSNPTASVVFAAEISSSGLPVSGFGTNGIATNELTASDFPGLTLSGSFASGGKPAIDSTGKVYVPGVVGGDPSGDFSGFLVRFTAAGAADTGFGPFGNGVTSKSESSGYQLTTTDSAGAILAFTVDGNPAYLDSYSSAGVLGSSVSATNQSFAGTPNFSLQSDGKILVFQDAQNNILRFVGTSEGGSSSGGSSSSSSSSSSSGGSSSSSSSSGASSSGSSSSGSSSSGSSNSSGGGAFNPLLMLPLMGFAALRRKKTVQ